MEITLTDAEVILLKNLLENEFCSLLNDTVKYDDNQELKKVHMAGLKTMDSIISKLDK